MKAKSFSNVLIRSVVILTFLLLFCFLLSSRAEAEAIDYLSSNYNGTVTRDTGADMYSEPGSVNPTIKDADGETVHLDYGTEVFITGEEFDPDMDMWYRCSAEIDGVIYEGFVFNKRVTRGDSVPFTPTPTPTITPTPTPAPATDGDANPGDLGQSNNMVSDETKEMLEDSKGAKPWIGLIVLAIIIIIFLVGYTLWVRESERKLEREIERYSNRPQYEPLEGELEEDFMEARANYYDHIGLGAQANKDLDNIMSGTPDVKLDMTGVFDDEPAENKVETVAEEVSAEDETSLQDLIASLEKRLGSEQSQEETKSETRRATAADHKLAALFEEDEEEFDAELELRDILDDLNVGRVIHHKIYGEGIVEDNSDSQIIQVRFGSDIRYLKKDKLVKKNLIKI